MSDQFSGICNRCSKRKDCTAPCAPVEYEVKPERGSQVYQKVRVIDGRTVIVVYPRNRREVSFSTLMGSDPDAGCILDRVSSDEAAEMWPEFETEKKLTGIFVDRLVNQMSFEDISVKWECGSEKQARYYFYFTKDRLLEVLKYFDNFKRADNATHDKNTGKLTKTARAFLLCKCFDLSAKEVAEIIGITPDHASKYIKTFYDQLKAGKNPLIIEADDQTGINMSIRSARKGEIQGRVKMSEEERRLKVKAKNERYRERLKEARAA